ncbi:DMT family transporter, partial [Micrococcus endophyticus]|uniref:DMT family transporter n=1 Tax=Micrococcus endophyticus TaxID=455343 RepID=UPI0034D00ED2
MPASRATTVLLATLALVAGVAMPLQGRINSAVSLQLGSPVHAALISFSTGLAVMTLMSVLLPVGRRSVARIPAAVKAGHVRWWQMLAGMIGAVFVFSQALTIPVIGVAVFTVAVVTGQMLGGMTLDRLGWTPAGVQRISPRRLIGAVLAFVAVVTVVWPSLQGTGSPGAWLLLALVPLVAGAGAGTSVQQVLNGQQTAHYGNPIPATLVNFVAGVALLAVLTGVTAVASGGLAPPPGTWWMYLSGPLGCVFIGLAAFLVPRIGAFLTTLGMVGGQLLGSLLLDVVAPAPGSHITGLTVAGTLGALVAMVIASTPQLPVGLRR